MQNFPFYKQETNYTCGSAVMRMALEFCGIKRSEKQISKLLKTNKIRGTWHKSFPLVAEKFKLNYVVLRNATLLEAKHLQKKGFIIILCYFFPKEKIDHYSLLKKIDKNHIHFFDPYHGKEHKYTLTHFKKVWKSCPIYESEVGWLFALKAS